jgi:uncharacterized protein (TIGR02246 family)
LSFPHGGSLKIITEVIMSRSTIRIVATVVLALSGVTNAAEGQNSDPRSVLTRFVEAQNTGELDAALALWAEDGVIINTRGRTVAGKENLRKFIQTNISRKIKQEPQGIQTVGDKVTWINRESNESYRKLNVAPVQQNSEILVRDGKIISWGLPAGCQPLFSSMAQAAPVTATSFGQKLSTKWGLRHSSSTAFRGAG